MSVAEFCKKASSLLIFSIFASLLIADGSNSLSFDFILTWPAVFFLIEPVQRAKALPHHAY